MDELITAAARALAVGDPIAALKRVALRDDAPALALRGVAMAQLGDLARARELVRRAARAFGPHELVARSRCALAEAEIALVCRDLGRSMQALAMARGVLAACGDRANAAHAGYPEARYLLLIGRLEQAETALAGIDVEVLPLASRAGYALVTAGIEMRRIRTEPAREALDRAKRAAQTSAIPALLAEVERSFRLFDAPIARLFECGRERLIRLDDVEVLLASDALVVDACRNVVRAGEAVVSLASRPVLFALVRTLAQAWPGDVPRETLLVRAFRAKNADESHRARLRVEIGRLRKSLEDLAQVNATRRGFALGPQAKTVAVLAPPVESDHAQMLALLADGEAWSSSALALALAVSPRTVLRALADLARGGMVDPSVADGLAAGWRPTCPDSRRVCYSRHRCRTASISGIEVAPSRIRQDV